MTLNKSLKLAAILLVLGGAQPEIFAASIGTSAKISEVATSLDVRRAALNSLLAEQWEYKLRANPEFASMLGDKRYNDKLSDFSQAAIDADQKADLNYLKRFSAIDSKGFSVQEKLNKDLMVQQLKSSVAGVRFKDWQMPVLQNSGIHLNTPELVAMLSFVSVKDYDDYVARLNALPKAFDETIIQMHNGVKNKLMPPQFLLEKIARQCDDIAALKLDATPFTQPLKKFPADFSDADKQRLSLAIKTAVEQKVVPTYQKFAKFVREEYVPHGRR